jgi:hypothetical protein
VTGKPGRWVSPRHDRQAAIAMGERRADEYERLLGRPLTPAELRHVHAEARRVTAQWGRIARKAASS